MTTKPVLIIQHTQVAQPGLIVSVLKQLGLSWQILNLEQGELLPTSFVPYSGVVLLGGAVSANSTLSWIEPELDLLRQAYQLGLPIMAHCLGAQLLSKALGAQVSPSLETEIGWQQIDIENLRLSAHWFGVQQSPWTVFQWHGEMFSLPAQAQRIFSSPACPNQAYVLDDKHLALQFHLEITPDLIQGFIQNSGVRIAQERLLANPYVHTVEQIRLGWNQYKDSMQRALLHVYQRWAQNLWL